MNGIIYERKAGHKMKKIKEMIVVEGKNDTNTLQRYFVCDTIETGGDQLVPEIIDRVKAAQASRGVIVFTDPDHPGEQIRRWINSNVPECKNAFIDKKKARTAKKVGVEHAEKNDLWQALSHCVTFEEDRQTLSWQDYVSLGLTGNTAKRYGVCAHFHIGPCNGKTCFKRLNAMGITTEQIKEYENEQSDRNDS